MLGLGSFTIDGGTGADTFTAAGLNLGVSINLDTKIDKVHGVDLAAQSALTTAGHVGGTVKGFETVIGSTVVDLIAGGKAAETLSGLAGDDFLAGGGGADNLTGGAGNDTFVFPALTDSGLTRAARDTLTDFKGIGAGGGDKIDLSAIDANTKLVTNQAFVFKGRTSPSATSRASFGPSRTVRTPWSRAM
jgi:Ca2+-binding RTX toxin-like protein